MTYYSDLLIVIDELEALEFGKRPKRPVEELRALCMRILAIEPDEELASQLLAALDGLPPDTSRDGLVSFLAGKARKALRVVR